MDESAVVCILWQSPLSKPKAPLPVKTELPRSGVRRLLPFLLLPFLQSAHLPLHAGERLPRENLLVWQEEGGRILPVASREDWLRRRQSIVRGMERVMGPFPGEFKRCALDISIEEETDCGTYLRRRISYQSEPGGRVPAYLCIPKDALKPGARAFGVLCLHPTDANVGHGVVVGLGGKANRQYASELCERGFVTIAPGYPLLANYQPDIDALGYQSGTMKAIWDNCRALDVLESLPFVQPGRFGAIGHSLGGHNSVYTAVFEPRIQTVISSCGLDSFLDYYGANPAVWKPEKGWCQKRYMPGLLSFADDLRKIPFDFHELIGALAPRNVLISAPLHDSNFRWESVDRIQEAAAEVYRLLGKPAALRVVHPDAPHDFPDAVREEAYGLLKETLR